MLRRMFVHRCQLLKYLNCDSVANERKLYVLKFSVHIIYGDGHYGAVHAAVVNTYCKVIIILISMSGRATASAPAHPVLYHTTSILSIIQQVHNRYTSYILMHFNNKMSQNLLPVQINKIHEQL